MTIAGISQILLLSDSGVISLSPAEGKLPWKYSWPQENRILQPSLTAEGDLLISGDQYGIRRISVTSEASRWKIKEHWTSAEFSPIFNDIVIQKGHAYGINGRSLASIDLKDGTRKWQGGHFGGQILLLADQDILLVLTEKGELELVSASPDKFTELASFPAIKGKTWNHPVLVGDILVVRNSQEMAAFRLPLAGS